MGVGAEEGSTRLKTLQVPMKKGRPLTDSGGGQPVSAAIREGAS